MHHTYNITCTTPFAGLQYNHPVVRRYTHSFFSIPKNTTSSVLTPLPLACTHNFVYVHREFEIFWIYLHRRCTPLNSCSLARLCVSLKKKPRPAPHGAVVMFSKSVFGLYDKNSNVLLQV